MKEKRDMFDIVTDIIIVIETVAVIGCIVIYKLIMTGRMFG